MKEQEILAILSRVRMRQTFGEYVSPTHQNPSQHKNHRRLHMKLKHEA